MAERITGGPPIGYSPEVGWGQWADGAEWKLTRGVDFTQPAPQARRAFLSWASRRSLATHSSVVDANTLRIQVVGPREDVQPEQGTEDEQGAEDEQADDSEPETVGAR